MRNHAVLPSSVCFSHNTLITIDDYNAQVNQLHLASSNSHRSAQVPQPQPMHRAPSRTSRNAKKNRTCGKQVLSVVTTWFKPAETPVHQTPIRAVPMHEISPLFAPQSQSHDIPRLQHPQAIPIKSLHNISPLFPRLDDRVAPTTPQVEYPFPRGSTDLLMPHPLRPVKLKQHSLRPVVYPHDSFLSRAKRANLEPVLGGEAEEYYRSTAEYQGIPTVRPVSQRRPFSDCSDRLASLVNR